MQVMIIGTVHLDPEGNDLLKLALDMIRPELITIDVSRYAVDFRRGRGAELMARLKPFRHCDGLLPPGLQAVEAQIAVPYEVLAADAWCVKYNKQYILVGDCDDSRNRLDTFENELMSADNLSRLASENFPTLVTQVNRQWEKARAGFHTMPAIEPCDERIAALLKSHIPCPGTVCHITGWEHLSQLERLLADHAPVLKLLDAFRPGSAGPL